MSNLTIVKQHGQLMVESRQVAEMVEKEHKHLLRDIQGYTEILGQSNFGLTDFFIESTYLSEQKKILPCYLITKKGCELVGNKMTGEKGVLFTAAYVTKFNEMENEIKPLSQLEIIAVMAQAAADQEKQLNQIAETQVKQAEELQGIRNVVALNSTGWREDSKKLIAKMADKLGGFDHIQTVRKETYVQLNRRIGVDIDRRLLNKRQRMALEGVCKSKCDKVNYLDIIADDKKLLEAYLAIIKEMAIKAGVA